MTLSSALCGERVDGVTTGREEGPTVEGEGSFPAAAVLRATAGERRVAISKEGGRNARNHCTNEDSHEGDAAE